MKHAHTPGPYHGRSEMVNGRLMWAIYQGRERIDGFSQDKFVAYFEKHADAIRFTHEESAAPEMLEALELAVEQIEYAHKPKLILDTEQALRAIKTAIAKARGEG